MFTVRSGALYTEVSCSKLINSFVSAVPEFEDLCFQFGIELDGVVRCVRVCVVCRSASLILRHLPVFLVPCTAPCTLTWAWLLVVGCCGWRVLWVPQTSERKMAEAERRHQLEKEGKDKDAADLRLETSHLSDEELYKIDVPANRCVLYAARVRAYLYPLTIRLHGLWHALALACTFSYDLLCLDGLARSLRIFLDQEANPVYKMVTPPQVRTGLVWPNGTSDACSSSICLSVCSKKYICLSISLFVCLSVCSLSVVLIDPSFFFLFFSHHSIGLSTSLCNSSL